MSDDFETIYEDGASESSRSRAEFVQGCGLSPDNLVGSFYMILDGGAMEEKGLIVAEVQAATPSTHSVYLVEVRLRAEADSPYQHLVRFETMLEEEWLFFDTEEWLEKHERLVYMTATATERGAR